MKAYKQTQAVKKVRENIDRYLAGMAAVYKKPETIWLTRADFNRLVNDENKYLASVIENPKPVERPSPIKDIPVRCLDERA